MLGWETVKRGVTWYAFQYGHELTATERQDYLAAEKLAREQRLGLWAEPDPMPPWVCRKLRKIGQKCR